jgi:membrane protein implicated in regulation of membrane protease activity
MAKQSLTDTLVASLFLIFGVIFLVQRRMAFMSVWLVLISVIIAFGLRTSPTVAVLIGFVAVFLVAVVSRNRLLERFENDSQSEESKEEKKKTPEPHGEDDTHMDVGSTILHAYRKLDPEQVMQMRKDTQELMSTQKNLMETLANLGPQVQQGAQLIETFKKTFGATLSGGSE